MKRRKNLAGFCCTILLLFAVPALSAANEIDIGSITANTNMQGEFNFVLTPQLNINKFSLQFNILVKGTYTVNPLSLTFDFSNYLFPQREEADTDWLYAKRVLKQYSQFIKTMHYGYRFDPFYFRYGKLENNTLGDGALLSSYYDNSVKYLESRPGFNLKFGPIGHFGFEYITDDLFIPTMTGGRLYILPFAIDTPEKASRLNKMEFAFSYLTDPREYDATDPTSKKLFLSCYEIAQPLFSGENGQTTLFADFLTQGEKTDLLGGGKALRFGLWGRTAKWMTFNFSLLTPVVNTYYVDYFATGYNDETSNEYEKEYPLYIGKVHLDGTLGVSMDSEQLYAGVRFRSNLSSEGFSGQRILATIRIDRFLFNVLTLDLNYEKTYPEENGTQEAFFPGLVSLKNVYIKGNAQVKINGVKFVISGSANFDKDANVEDYSMNMAVEIVLF